MRLWLLDVISFSFPAFTDELHGKGREVHIEERGGCIIVDDNDEDDYQRRDGGRKRRATSIEHCLHSIEQIGSAPLLVSRFHAWTRKCGPPYRTLHYPPPWRGIYERKGWRSYQRCSVNVLQHVDRAVAAAITENEIFVLLNAKASMTEISRLRYN